MDDRKYGPSESDNKVFGQSKKISGKISGIAFLPIFLLLLFYPEATFAQNNHQMVRIAKLQIDPLQLEAYRVALKEEIETSIRIEPGVKTLYAVSEKNNPSRITILEIYADSSAYHAHIVTPHFLKYKADTKDMVKSLELVEAIPLVPEMKIR